MKYLGVLLDNKLTFSKQIENTLNKFYTTKHKLLVYPMINYNSCLLINTKLLYTELISGWLGRTYLAN